MTKDEILQTIIARHRALVKLLGEEHDHLWHNKAICIRTCDCMKSVMAEHGYKVLPVYDGDLVMHPDWLDKKIGPMGRLAAEFWDKWEKVE